jgi:hypothetical protein
VPGELAGREPVLLGHQEASGSVTTSKPVRLDLQAADRLAGGLDRRLPLAARLMP